MCRAGQFNLSYQSLTSFNARETLRNLKTTNPEFWRELTGGRSEDPVNDDQVVDEDDIEAQAAHYDDDSDLPCDAVIAHVVHGQVPVGTEVRAGHLVSTAAAEAIDYEGKKLDWADDVTFAIGEASSSRAPGKRKVKVNQMYSGTQFWHH